MFLFSKAHMIHINNIRRCTLMQTLKEMLYKFIDEYAFELSEAKSQNPLAVWFEKILKKNYRTM